MNQQGYLTLTHNRHSKQWLLKGLFWFFVFSTLLSSDKRRDVQLLVICNHTGSLDRETFYILDTATKTQSLVEVEDDTVRSAELIKMWLCTNLSLNTSITCNKSLQAVICSTELILSRGLAKLLALLT